MVLVFLATAAQAGEKFDHWRWVAGGSRMQVDYIDYAEVRRKFPENPRDCRDWEGWTWFHRRACIPAWYNAVVHLGSFEEALKRGLDPRTRDCRGQTALHVAAGSSNCPSPPLRHSFDEYRRQQQEHFEALLHHGVEPDVRDHRKRTALHYAAAKANLEKLAPLLLQGASPSLRDSAGDSPLDALVREAYWGWPRVLAAVAMLVSSGAPLRNHAGSPARLRALVRRTERPGYPQTRTVDPRLAELLEAYIQAPTGGQGRPRTDGPGWVQVPATPARPALVLPARFAAHLAIGLQEEGLLGEVLRRGADPDSEWGGKTPLEVALGGPDLQVVERLVAAGARLPCGEEGLAPWIRSQFGSVRLAWPEPTVHPADVARAALILRAGCADPVPTDFEALLEESRKHVEGLVAPGEDSGTGGGPALGHDPLDALLRNHLRVERLLDRGPAAVERVRVHAPELLAPLAQAAAAAGKLDVVARALEAGLPEDRVPAVTLAALEAEGLGLRSSRTEIQEAVEAGDLPAVERLLAAGSSPEMVTARGESLLHLAAGPVEGARGPVLDARRAAVILALVEAGADTEARDARGDTPLHRALTSARGTTLRLRALLAAGANLQAKDGARRTPLDGATSREDLEQVVLLCAAGADADGAGWAGPLRELEGKPTDAGAPAAERAPPFSGSVAAEVRRRMIVETLLQYGARPTQVRGSPRDLELDAGMNRLDLEALAERVQVQPKVEHRVPAAPGRPALAVRGPLALFHAVLLQEANLVRAVLASPHPEALPRWHGYAPLELWLAAGRPCRLGAADVAAALVDAGQRLYCSVPRVRRAWEFVARGCGSMGEIPRRARCAPTR